MPPLVHAAPWFTARRDCAVNIRAITPLEVGLGIATTPIVGVVGA
jgi:hypothetical protein